MTSHYINTSELKSKISDIKVGDRVFLSGIVYTARDAAHKRLFELLGAGTPLPVNIDGAAIYYAGPTPSKQDAVIGSCGPTTSSRMDIYTPRLIELGLTATIGKGERNAQVCEAIKNHRSLYLCAIGGAGALAASHITSFEVIAFDDLGCESIKRLEFDNFPLICAIDSNGGNIFKR
ncbi:MAG: fumarate hydratase C-terminal domain-containing protein [Clostridia bacterium]|nr:fumarate hydratase C-terminal domain-containing protein [Clostridia bacterium]